MIASMESLYQYGTDAAKNDTVARCRPAKTAQDSENRVEPASGT
jgi:hypothetical protein